MLSLGLTVGLVICCQYISSWGPTTSVNPSVYPCECVHGCREYPQILVVDASMNVIIEISHRDYGIPTDRAWHRLPIIEMREDIGVNVMSNPLGLDGLSGRRFPMVRKR